MESNDERDFTLSVEDRGLDHGQGVSPYDLEPSLNDESPNESRNREGNNAGRLVLGDATNTVLRQNNGSPTTTRTMLRRSHFH
jgi:hypothetical protein